MVRKGRAACGIIVQKGRVSLALNEKGSVLVERLAGRHRPKNTDAKRERKKLKTLSQYEIIKLLNEGYNYAEEFLKSCLRRGTEGSRQVVDREKKAAGA